MLIEPNLSDEHKKHLRDIAIPVLIAGLSTLAQELARIIAERIKLKLKAKKKKEEKASSVEVKLNE